MLRYERIAVFQINDNGGLARLICVHGVTFADRVRMEEFLRESSSFTVTSLGRFEAIDTVTGSEEFLNSCLPVSRQIGHAPGGQR